MIFIAFVPLCNFLGDYDEGYYFQYSCPDTNFKRVKKEFQRRKEQKADIIILSKEQKSDRLRNNARMNG
jgi:hypothetical protein